MSDNNQDDMPQTPNTPINGDPKRGMGVQKVMVDADDDGQRIDRWFFTRFPDIPKGHLYKLMRKGDIRLDGKRVKPESRIGAAQIVRIPPLQSRAAMAYQSKSDDNAIADPLGSGKNRRKLPVTQEQRDYFKSLVLYDDDDILAINKPSGLAVQGGSGIGFNLDAALHIFANEKGVIPRLVHRLDRQTSGVLILARSAEAARILGDFFKKNQMQKYYWALTSPAPRLPFGMIKAPLAKNTGQTGTSPQQEQVVIDTKHGKRAITLFRVLEKAGAQYAFICFAPQTGRTHQIRVHAAHANMPIIGDERYGGLTQWDDVFDGADKSSKGLQRRLYLHAHRMIMPHPMRKETLDIRAGLLPEDQIIWRHLGFRPDDPRYDKDDDKFDWDTLMK